MDLHLKNIVQIIFDFTSNCRDIKLGDLRKLRTRTQRCTKDPSYKKKKIYFKDTNSKIKSSHTLFIS